MRGFNKLTPYFRICLFNRFFLCCFSFVLPKGDIVTLQFSGRANAVFYVHAIFKEFFVP